LFRLEPWGVANVTGKKKKKKEKKKKEKK